MIRLLAKHRRVGHAVIWSVVVTIALLALFPTSYGMPPLNMVREFALTRGLPVFLGALAGACVSGVTPAMEALAGAHVKRARACVLAGVVAAQLIVLVGSVGLMNIALDVGVGGRDLLIFLQGTLLFQSIAIISAYLFLGPALWVIPLTAFFVQVFFPYRTYWEPNWWSALLTVNPATVSATIALAVVGMILMCRTHPGIITRWRQRAPVFV